MAKQTNSSFTFVMNKYGSWSFIVHRLSNEFGSFMHSSIRLNIFGAGTPYFVIQTKKGLFHLLMQFFFIIKFDKFEVLFRNVNFECLTSLVVGVTWTGRRQLIWRFLNKFFSIDLILFDFFGKLNICGETSIFQFHLLHPIW